MTVNDLEGWDCYLRDVLSRKRFGRLGELARELRDDTFGISVVRNSNKPGTLVRGHGARTGHSGGSEGREQAEYEVNRP